MKKLLIATNNKGKLIEMKAILGCVCDEVASYADEGILIDPVEDGTTFCENALIKARAGCAASGLPTLADDSGICVDALNGAPGVYSARFAGEHCDQKKNNQKLADIMKSVPESERGAHYACSVALVLPDGREFTSYGECDGVLIIHPAGENGFGYDPYFYVPEYGCTMAEIAPEEKNRISHRYRALAEMQRIISQNAL